MRALLVLLALSAFVCAQDQDAADLFYKAFWLEQAAGKTGEAYALYEKIVKEHAGAPEAPRALLGMTRISAAKGKDVARLLRLLETQYAKAKAEIEVARRIAAERLTPFNPEVMATDSPAMRKIKLSYEQILVGQIGEPDTLFLVEAGPLAHPMLSAVLRAPNYIPVLRASRILVRQKSPKAYTVLEKALLDNQVLFKTAIVQTLRNVRIDSPGLAQAMVKVYLGSSPSLQQDIVSTMARLTAVEGETRRIAYDLLTRALAHKESDVRKAALKAGSSAPDKYTAARLERMEKGDPIFESYHYSELLRAANRPQFAGRALEILKGITPSPNYRWAYADPGHAEGAMLLAQAGLGWFAKQPNNKSVRDAVSTASGWSAKAAAWLLSEAVRAGTEDIVQYVAAGIRSRLHPNTSFGYSALHSQFTAEYRSYLGGEADRLVRDALTASFSKDRKRQEAGAKVARMVGLGPSGDKLLVEAIKKHPKAPLPSVVFFHDTLRAYGPERMARVAVLARSQQEYDKFLRAGVVFTAPKAYPDGGYRFFEVVVPRAGPGSVAALSAVAAASFRCRVLVAQKLLQSKGKEWNWQDRGRRSGVSVVWRHAAAACADPKLLPITLRLTADSRLQVASTALELAGKYKNAAAMEALVKGLKAPAMNLRSDARAYLAQRGKAGIAAIVANSAWEEMDVAERVDAIKKLGTGGGEAAREFLAAKLALRSAKWWPAWDAYFELAREEAVELALVEVFGPGAKEHRRSALRVLTRTRDERRIPIFARVLRTSDNDNIYTVVQTVSEQYLIELGAQVLEQLRSPERHIREAATKAIERLKFYADAKETFKNKR